MESKDIPENSFMPGKQGHTVLVSRSHFSRNAVPGAVVPTPLQSQCPLQNLLGLCSPSPHLCRTSAFRWEWKSNTEKAVLSHTTCCRGSGVVSSFIFCFPRSMIWEQIPNLHARTHTHTHTQTHIHIHVYTQPHWPGFVSTPLSR